MSESQNSSGDLVCVLFPGVVKNEDRAVQCLGGIRNISQVYSQNHKKRLGLCYQPENPFIKRTYGDIKRTAGVLLKIKVKKKRENGEIKREVISTSVMGRVNEIYRFESMCDFQYLPVNLESTTGKTQCIIESILPNGVDDFSFLSNRVPLHILPTNFTRSDKPLTYSYVDKRYPDKKDFNVDDDNIHHRTRSDRALPSNRINFNLVDVLPTEPHAYFIETKEAKAKTYPQINEEFERVKKLFEERPIWSLNLIRYHTKIRSNSLKIIMPCVSIYFKDGPWRMLWVKFGYDPRKEPEARKYQTLDFRLRHAAGVRTMVMPRDRKMMKKCSTARNAQRNRDDCSALEEVAEGAVYFRPGMAPAQRQIYYQFCDVKLPEVEQLVSQSPPTGFLCHQKRGWFGPHVDDECRDHIFRYAKQTLLASHSADLKLELQQGSSDEEYNSDDATVGTGEGSSANENDEISLNA